MTPDANARILAFRRQLLAFQDAKLPSLNNRQWQIFLAVALPENRTPGGFRVGALAKLIDVQKPVVTRIVSALAPLGYLERRRGEDDLRDCFVVPGAKADALLAQLAGALEAAS